MASLASVTARHAYVLGLFDQHLPEAAAFQASAIDDLLPTLASTLALSDHGAVRARTYLGDTLTMFRFMRRWKYDPDDAMAALEKTLTWRLQSELDLLGPSSLDPLYADRPLFFFHPSLKDRLGRPCGVLNLKEVKRTEDGKLEGLKEFIAWGWEVARRWLADLSMDQQFGGAEEDEPREVELPALQGEGLEARTVKIKPKIQISVILDLKDAGMSNLEMELLPYFMDLLKNHFPGMIGTIFVLHYTWFYSGMWQVAKRILPSQALDRIVFPSESELLEFFDPDHLLVEHGGNVEYRYDIRTNEVAQRFGRPLALQPGSNPASRGPSPMISRKSSFESIHDVFFSAPPTPLFSNSTATTPPASGHLPLPSNSSAGTISSRPSWLSMTSLPAAGGGPGLGEAIRRNQRKPGRRPALKASTSSTRSLGLTINVGEDEVDLAEFGDPSDDDDEGQEGRRSGTVTPGGTRISRHESHRDFRSFLPRGIGPSRSGPPSESSSTTSGGAHEDQPDEEDEERRRFVTPAATDSAGRTPDLSHRQGSRMGSRMGSRVASREPSPHRNRLHPSPRPSPRQPTHSPSLGGSRRHRHHHSSRRRKRDLVRTFTYLAALRFLALNRELRWQATLVLHAFEQTFRLERLWYYGSSLVGGSATRSNRAGFATAGVPGVDVSKGRGGSGSSRRKGVTWAAGERGDRDRDLRTPGSGSTSKSDDRASALSSARRRYGGGVTSVAHRSYISADAEISPAMRSFALFLVFLVIRSTWFTGICKSLFGLASFPARLLTSGGPVPLRLEEVKVDGSGRAVARRTRRRDRWLARAGLR